MFEIFAVAKEIEQFVMSFFMLHRFAPPIRFKGMAEGEHARAAPFHLHEFGGRKDGAHQSQVEQVLAVIASGHHADGDAHARPGAAVAGQKMGAAGQVVVGKGDSHLLGVHHVRGNLHGKVRVVFAGEHEVRDLVENLGDPGGMAPADAEDDALADLAADGVFLGVFHESAAELDIGVLGKEMTLKIALVEDLFGAFLVIGFRHQRIALIREQLGGDLGAAVNGLRIDQAAIAHAIRQGIAVSGYIAIAAEGLIGG